MKFNIIILFIAIGIAACEVPSEKRISIDDIKDSSHRAMDMTVEDKIMFLDTDKQIISPDRFNQLLAEGIYLSSQKTKANGTEVVQLISLAEHELLLESQSLPSFHIQDLNGKEYSETSFQGKLTVLSFWFTASKLCTQEIQNLNKLAKKYNQQEDFIWLAPALDNAADLSRYLKNQDWFFDFAADQEQLALKLGILTYPTHLVINQEGKIIKAFVRNQQSMEQIEKTIKELI